MSSKIRIHCTDEQCIHCETGICTAGVLLINQEDDECNARLTEEDIINAPMGVSIG